MNDSKKDVSFHRTLLSLALIGLITAISLYTEHALANPVVSARSVDTIQIKQAKSIEEGARIGRLTPKEVSRLRDQQHRITTVERDMREDGGLNTVELEKLFQQLQYAQNQINKLLRNNVSCHPPLDN